MGERFRRSLPGGCVGGGLAGLLGTILGGWITFTFLEQKIVPLEDPISAAKIYLFVTVNMFLLTLVVAGALAAGVAGILVGSMFGALTLSRLHATPDVSVSEANAERPQSQLGWVNGAIYGLVALGLCGVAGSTLWLVLGDERAQAIACLLWGVMGFASGMLLSKRLRTGQVLGVVFVLPGLLVLPYGTVVAPILLYALCCSQTRRYLSR